MDRNPRKRLFSEVEQLGIRKRSSSRERKRIRLDTEKAEPHCEPSQRLHTTGIKRLYSEMAEDISSVQEMPSKRRRLASNEEMMPVIEEDATETRKALLKKVWIIGSSYIYHGEKAAFKFFGENFGLKAKVQWFGKGGLRWTGVLPCFYREQSIQSPPDILVIHAAGNDIGLTPAKQLAYAMTMDLIQLHKEFPNMKILFSCINERRVWHYGEPRIINGERRIVNELMTKALPQFGGEVIQHPLVRFFKKDLYLPDGMNFTQKGNHVFLSAMHKALRKTLLRQRLTFPLTSKKF